MIYFCFSYNFQIIKFISLKWTFLEVHTFSNWTIKKTKKEEKLKWAKNHSLIKSESLRVKAFFYLLNLIYLFISINYCEKGIFLPSHCTQWHSVEKGGKLTLQAHKIYLLFFSIWMWNIMRTKYTRKKGFRLLVMEKGRIYSTLFIHYSLWKINIQYMVIFLISP